VCAASGLLSMNLARPGNGQESQKFGQNTGQTAKVEVSNIFRLGEMIGLEVHNRQHKRLGKIDDVVVNMHNGEIRYAILAHGGVAGVGSKLYAVPWSQLTFVFSDKDKYFVFDVTPEQLQAAPGFDAANWPDLSDPKWATNFDEYFHRLQPTVTTGHQPTAGDEMFFIRASKIKGMKVRNNLSENLGNVDEVVFNLKAGKIKYLALSYGSIVVYPRMSISF
jgi:sporulation protein YlmC with PRC-barrel domain